MIYTSIFYRCNRCISVKIKKALSTFKRNDTLDIQIPFQNELSFKYFWYILCTLSVLAFRCKNSTFMHWQLWRICVSEQLLVNCHIIYFFKIVYWIVLPHLPRNVTRADFAALGLVLSFHHIVAAAHQSSWRTADMTLLNTVNRSLWPRFKFAIRSLSKMAWLAGLARKRGGGNPRVIMSLARAAWKAIWLLIRASRWGRP